MLSAVLRYLFLVGTKILGRALFSAQARWVGPRPPDAFHDVRLLVILNHTSLYELLMTSVTPSTALWALASRGVYPGAAGTLERPLVGLIYRLISPRAVPISRSRDESWQVFLDSIKPTSFVMILPEGRMKRPGGLDKNGRPMRVRPGVVDILQRLGHGKLLLSYSGGLHHVQAPGERLPRLFQPIEWTFEEVEISDYLAGFGPLDDEALREAVVADLARRRDTWGGALDLCCPRPSRNPR